MLHTATVPPNLVPAEVSRTFQSHCKIQDKTLQQNHDLYVLQAVTVGVEAVSHLAIPLSQYQVYFKEGSELICSGEIATSVVLALKAAKPAQSRSRRRVQADLLDDTFLITVGRQALCWRLKL